MCDEKTAAALAKLRAPFEPHQISKLPKPTKQQTDEVKADYKKGIRCPLCDQWHHPKVVHLDYVGHAALTDRLLDVDPLWTWEPLAFDDAGLPKLDQVNGLWIKLTVCGVTRMGYGDAEGKTGGNAVKERIGDALRNAAMRFGAALDLWHKGDLHLDGDEPKEGDEPKKGAPSAPPAPPTAWDIDSDSEFVTTLDRAYKAFKAGLDDPKKAQAEYEKFSLKCKCRKSEPAEKVLTEMAAHVEKLENAAKAKAEKLAKAS